jgi:hypothetical protein
LFSGIIVKFDKLHPWFASERSVPWIGNIMASRWAYEGLAVTQFMENRYEKQFYPLDRRMKTANWKKDLWIRELENASGNVRRALADLSTSAGMEHDLSLLRGELERETKALNGFEVPLMDRLEPGRVDLKVLDQVDAALRTLTQHYRTAYKTAEAEKEQLITQLTGTSVNRSEYFAQLDAYRNESLADRGIPWGTGPEERSRVSRASLQRVLRCPVLCTCKVPGWHPHSHALGERTGALGHGFASRHCALC